MYGFAVLFFLFVFAVENIGNLDGWRGILWLIAAIILAFAMLFQFVPFPFAVQRKGPTT